MYGWNDNYTTVEFNDLVGQVITGILINDEKDEMRIRCANGEEYIMLHEQDCCENVYIEDIAGDLNDAISFVVSAEEVTSNENPEGVNMEERYQDSFTWTFYKIQTNKGAVTIRWYGSSNGYYSESVSLYKTRWREEAADDIEAEEQAEAPLIVTSGITGEWQ